MHIALRSAALVIAAALVLSAQPSNKPDFSGTWQLDVQRTRFGKLPKPKSVMIQIEHREPQIRLLTVTVGESGEVRENLELTTDGKQSATAAGESCMAAAQWDRWTGKRLLVEVTCPGTSSSRRLTLGSKGKMLTTVLTLRDASGEKKVYEFFFKQ